MYLYLEKKLIFINKNMLNEIFQSLRRDEKACKPEKQLQYMDNNVHKLSRITAGEHHSDVHLSSTLETLYCHICDYIQGLDC
jgi:hypothetical protein